MKRPLIYSAVLHFTVIILLLIGFYNPFERTQLTETPMMIEFVHVAEQSAAPQLAPEVIKEAEQPEPPKPTPLPTPPQPDPTPPQPEPEPQPQPEPEPVKPEPPKPETKPEPKPEPEAEPIPDPKAKEKPKEKPKEKKPEKQKVDITLDKKKKSTPKTDDQKDKKKKPSKSFDDLLNEIEKDEDGAPSRGKGAPAATIGPELTASEKDALSRHMARCWIIPAALRGEKNLRVPIELHVSKDGTIKKAEIMDKGRMGREPAYRTAAESARRAVLDPNCSPLPIPQDKYEMFKKFIFNFDPKEMLPQ